jgi:hypothetical protein
MALSGSGWLAMHAAARALGVQWRVGTRRYSAVLGVARGWARARAVTCIVTLVGAQWCLCRSAASGARRHSVALNGARARARWHESWHSATLCSARWSSAAAVERGGMRQVASRSDTARRRSAALCSARVALSGARRRFAAHGGAQRHAVERGGGRQAASRSDTARWRSVARKCVHLVALSDIRWRSAAGVGLRGRFGASQNRLAGSCSAPAQISVRSVLAGMARSAAHSGARWCTVALENWAPLNAKVESFMSLGGLGATRCHSVPLGCRWRSAVRGGTRWHALARSDAAQWH